MRLIRPALALIAIGGSALAQSAPVPAWRAGTAREVITPPAGSWMTGYAARNRPTDGTAQELSVKALAVADPADRRGVLLTLDLCGIPRDLTDRVAAELLLRHNLPRSALMVNVSHTHCSPVVEGSLIGIRLLPPDGQAVAAAYRRDLEAKMIRAASQALANLAPAEISWGEDEATFAINRRENLEKDAPALKAAGKLKGPVDPRVPVLAVRDSKGSLIALLVSYACHNTTLSFYQWHGDYAGCAQAELETRHPGATVLFAIGCGADINPNPRGTIELAQSHGQALADAADRALARPMQPVAGNFASALEDITLTFSRQPTPEQIREAKEKVQPNREMHQAWAAAMSEQTRRHGGPVMSHNYPVQVWRLGGLAWAALGGEVVVDYSLRLRGESESPLWVFGYTNDVMAYIPSERVLKEGRYEGETSMIPYGRPGPWTAGLEGKIVSTTHTLLERTRAR